MAKNKNMALTDNVEDTTPLAIEKKTKKTTPKIAGYDLGGGKVHFEAKGWADGETFDVVVNGVKGNVTVEQESGIYSASWSFKEHPAVEIKS
jgi:hypothetical protein